jgi:hypothetical protein
MKKKKFSFSIENSLSGELTSFANLSDLEVIFFLLSKFKARPCLQIESTDWYKAMENNGFRYFTMYSLCPGFIWKLIEG